MSSHEIKTKESVLRWLARGEYKIGGPFIDGRIGLTRRDVGGLWGVFTDGLIEGMVKDGYLTSSHEIARRGHAVLAEGVDP